MIAMQRQVGKWFQCNVKWANDCNVAPGEQMIVM